VCTAACKETGETGQPRLDEPGDANERMRAR
jgi:hypothetical protein